MSFERYKGSYRSNWDKLKIRDRVSAQVRDMAARIRTNKKRYQTIEQRTGVPWWFVGLCHYRESTFDFTKNLCNGEPLNQRTKLEPKGRGPYKNFEDSAVDAFKIKGWLGIRDWGIERTSYRLEAYNGFGYRKHGVNSPYLYGGSTLYGPPEEKGGKYIRDKVFDSKHIDRQLGTLTVLKKLTELENINFGNEDDLETGVLWAQQILNLLGQQPKLEEDGLLGKFTKKAISAFQKQHKLEETGLLNTATVDALQTAHATLLPSQHKPDVNVTPSEIAASTPKHLPGRIRDLLASLFD